MDSLTQKGVFECGRGQEGGRVVDRQRVRVGGWEREWSEEP